MKQDFYNLVNSLVGKPFDEEEFHCWHLVESLLPSAPRIKTVATTYSALKLMRKDYPDCREIENPMDMCIVLMGVDKDLLSHAGVYFDNSIVHADRLGVRVEPMGQMLNRYPSMKFLLCM